MVIGFWVLRICGGNCKGGKGAAAQLLRCRCAAIASHCLRQKQVGHGESAGVEFTRR